MKDFEPMMVDITDVELGRILLLDPISQQQLVPLDFHLDGGSMGGCDQASHGVGAGNRDDSVVFGTKFHNHVTHL